MSGAPRSPSSKPSPTASQLGDPSTQSRRADPSVPSTTRKGQRAERLAADYLARQGYQLLRTNYRCRRGEIDIIALEGQVLCFVEVRSLATARHGHPLETIDGAKRRRLLAAARHYLARQRGPAREVRFDALGIVYGPQLELRLVRGAFEDTSAW